MIPFPHLPIHLHMSFCIPYPHPSSSLNVALFHALSRLLDFAHTQHLLTYMHEHIISWTHM